MEDGLFPTSSIWNSPSSTVRSAFQSLDASVSEMRRPKLSVLPLLRAIEEVAWAGAASSEGRLCGSWGKRSSSLLFTLTDHFYSDHDYSPEAAVDRLTNFNSPSLPHGSGW